MQCSARTNSSRLAGLCHHNDAYRSMHKSCSCVHCSCRPYTAHHSTVQNSLVLFSTAHLILQYLHTTHYTQTRNEQNNTLLFCTMNCTTLHTAVYTTKHNSTTGSVTYTAIHQRLSRLFQQSWSGLSPPKGEKEFTSAKKAGF